MKKRTGSKRRVLAFLLAAALVLSGFGGTSMTGYAAQPETGEEAAETETSGTPEEAVFADGEAQTQTPESEAAETVQEEEPASSEESEETAIDGEAQSGEETSETSEETTEETTEEMTEETTEEETDVLFVPARDGEGEDDGTDTVADAAYTGTVGEEEGCSVLYIRWYEYIDALANGGATEEELAAAEFNDTVVLGILEARKEANADEKFNRISIDYGTVNDSISADLWNAVVERLEADTENRTGAGYNFHGETAADQNWYFENPATADAAVNTALTLTLPSDENAKLSVKFASTDFPADEAYLSLYTDESEARAAYYTAITKSFGTENCNLALYDAEGAEAENAGGSYELTTDTVTETDEEGNETNKEIQAVIVSIGNVKNLSANADYTLEKQVYSGRVDTWTDEQGNECSSLNIHFGEAGKETSLTEEELLAILELNAGKTFDEVNIDQCIGETNPIYKAVAEKAYTLLKPTAEGEERRLQFRFFDTATDAATAWILINPQADQSENTNVSAVMTIAEDNTVLVNIGSQSLAAEEVRVAFERSVEKDSASVDKLAAIFGGVSCDITAGDGAADGWFNLDEWNARIELCISDKLTAGENYTVTPKVYRGNIDEENNSIYISALELGEDKFGEGDLESILQYYIDNGRRFDVVHIEIKDFDSHFDNPVDSHVIKKEYVNLARELLSTEAESEKRLTFVFCGCYAEDGKFIQNDMNWSLINPGTAEEDICADAALELKANQRIKLSVSDNSYNADEVTLQFYANVGTDTAKQITSGLGEAYAEDVEDAALLMTYMPSKAAEHVKSLRLSDDTYADWRKSDGDRNVSLYIGNVQAMTSEYAYMLINPEKISEMITEKWQVPLPEGATESQYNNFNSDIAAIENNILTPLENGDVNFIVQYVLNGGVYWKAYSMRVGCALTSLAFEKTELTMELPEDGADWEARDYLNVRYYPSNAGVDRDPGSLTWTTSDASVVELIASEEDGKYRGEIKAVGAGKATIRAAYDDTIYAECVVTVEKPFVVPENEWGDVYALTNLHKTLADVALPSENWKWKDSSTKLEPYFGMERQRFAAIYTAEDGRTGEFMLEVRMVTITDVQICTITLDENNNQVWNEEIPAALADGETIVLNYGVCCENGGGDDIAGYFSTEEKKGRLQAVWSCSPSGSGASEAGAPYPTESYRFTADSSKSGKKTFTVSLVDTGNGNKVIAKDSVSVTVTKQPVMNYDRMIIDGLEELENGKAGDTGTLYLTVPKEGYYALTVKSTEAAVLALGRTAVKEEKAADGTEVYKTEVPYTIKKAGKVQLLVTAKDEIKSTQTIDVTIVDKEPKVLESSFNINKAYSEKKAPLTIAYTDSYGAADGSVVTTSGNYANDFTYVQTSYADGKASGYLTLKNTSLKNGTYEVGLKVKVRNQENAADTEEFTLTVKVKIADKKPKLTFKQTKKVNTFYKSTGENHSGLLTVNAPDAELVSLELKEGTKFKLEKTADENVYKLSLADNVTAIGKADKKVTLICTIRDAVYGTYTLEKALNVAVEEKAPKVVLSAKSDTLYTKLNYVDSTLLLTDSTGELLTCSTVAWVKDKTAADGICDFTEKSIEAQLKKNTFNIRYEGDGQIHFTLNTENAGTDKITLRVQEEDWTKPVDIAYSIKAETKLPKLKLKHTALTLNKNAEIGGQETDTWLYFAGCSADFRGSVYFAGADEKSKAILNDKLALEYWGDGRIVARLNTTKLNNKDLQAGKYKFTIKAIEGEFEAAATLTVTIADAAPETCVKVSKKGSIDVLRRESTYLSLTAKLKNLPGTVTDGWLTGQDADLFYAEFDSATGQLRVKAYEGTLLSTKNTYKVTPVFQVSTTTGNMYEVTAAEQSVKVKQGKPKLTITAPLGNVLYRQAGNSLPLQLSAALSGEAVGIEEAELLNYTDDLCAEYDSKTQTVSITQESMRKIASTGKKWKLQFAVSYRDKAGNEKKATVNYQVVIK